MAEGFLSLGYESFAPWLVWILPFAAALIIPAIAKGSKKAIGYTAVAFALMSALSAAYLLPGALEANEVHDQIGWIDSLGLKAGVLADPVAVIMANVVAWISFLIMIYSTGYMKGDKDLTRFWFWMLFFVGSMQLIVLSDNLLQVFFGWEGVGLASYGLISFWYRDKKKDHVGSPDRSVLGVLDYYSPTHAGMKAFIMTKIGDIMMLAGMFLIFAFAGTFGFKELLNDTTWATSMAAQGLLVPAAVLLFGGAVGKSAQFPLNEWLLEAMTGPTAVSALIHAATMVKAGVFLVARIGPLFFALGAAGILADQFFEVIAWTGAITALLLATQGMVNKEIKMVIGYMMMALGIAGRSHRRWIYCWILPFNIACNIQSIIAWHAWSASIPAAPSAKNSGPMRATRNTPAFTIVAACMSAETAVGPVIASSSHSFRGNWADFPTAPPKSSTAAGTSRPCAAIEVAHVVSFKSSLNPNVPANANIKNMPASIIISPIFVMMNAFMPACVGE